MRLFVHPQSRGSALIAVVGLLVILALMATAYLVTVRTDRQSTFASGAVSNVGGFPVANPASMDDAQNKATDIVKQSIIGVLTRAQTGAPVVYRSPTPDPKHDQYLSLFDHPATTTFLASRYPESRVLLGDAAGRGYWPFITAPFVDLTDTANLTPNLNHICLESPLDLSGNNIGVPASTPPAYPNAINDALYDPAYPDNPNNIMYAAGTAYKNRTLGRQGLRIGSVKLTYPANFVSPRLLAGKTRVFPAFVDTSNNPLFLAADAAGTGVADSGLFRLDVTPDNQNYTEDPGKIHPVTYWAAVRVVDNNAALNVNTAWHTIDGSGNVGDSNFAGNAFATNTLTYGFFGAFHANLSLETALQLPPAALAADLTALDAIRFGGAARAKTIPVNETTNTTRADYSFVTQGDAMENQLARRLANPGRLDTNYTYAALPLAESANLAYAFGLYNPNIPQALTENTIWNTALVNAPNMASKPGVLAGSMVVNPPKIFSYYPATADDVWFNTAYNFDPAARATLLSTGGAPLYAASGDVPPRGGRSLLVTSNPLTTTIPAHNMAGLPAGMTWTGTPNANLMPVHVGGASPLLRYAQKVNVNRDSFGELWRAYWEVMCNDTTPTAVWADPLRPGVNATDMFKSTLRSTAVSFDNSNQMYLRAALAATNTIAMRSEPLLVPADLGTAKDQILVQPVAALTTSPTAASVTVSAYGVHPQPFITEVYANTDNETGRAAGGGVGASNPNGYVAIELFNPFPIAVSMVGCKLVTYTRSGGGTLVAGTLNVDCNTLTPPLTSIPARSYVTIESGAGIGQRPSGVGTPVAGTLYKCNGLESAIGNELYLLRPQNPASPPALLANPNWVPLDSFDFTGLQVDKTMLTLPPLDPLKPTQKWVARWHYVRQTTGPAPASQYRWDCVYPGAYNPAEGAVVPLAPAPTAGVVNAPNPATPGFPNPLQQPRLEGTQFTVWAVVAGQPWSADTEPAPGANWKRVTWGRAHATGIAAKFGAADNTATYNRTFHIPLDAATTPMGAVTGLSPNPLGTTPKNQFPFGGFARDGDILNVPFIGAYRVLDPLGNLVELNPISMDSAFAASWTNYGQAVKSPNPEQVGRFCSLAAADGADNLYTGTDEYGFANKLFNYLTAQSTPRNDAAPNVDSNVYAAAQPVKNDVASAAANSGEDIVPVHGQININTASWQVLATVPWVREGDPGVAAGQAVNINRALAKAIVRYRDIDDGSVAAPGPYVAHGPFMSLFELNLIPGTYTAAQLNDTIAAPAFRDAAGNSGDTGIDFGQAQGELTAVSPANGDGVPGDYKQRFLMLTRVSNLLTTRSDSFTAYILVQAWQDAGTISPVLLGERRSAFIFDRLSPGTKGDNATTYTVPNNLKETPINTN